jgi:hypothetical protein
VLLVYHISKHPIVFLWNLWDVDCLWMSICAGEVSFQYCRKVHNLACLNIFCSWMSWGLGEQHFQNGETPIFRDFLKIIVAWLPLLQNQFRVAIICVGLARFENVRLIRRWLKEDLMRNPGDNKSRASIALPMA